MLSETMLLLATLLLFFNAKSVKFNNFIEIFLFFYWLVSEFSYSSKTSVRYDRHKLTDRLKCYDRHFLELKIVLIKKITIVRGMMTATSPLTADSISCMASGMWPVII